MTKQEKEQRRKEMLACICKIPKNIITLHGADNITEFLIYHLADRNCFNLSKAAFLIENKDFNRLKGIAGYKNGEYRTIVNHWNNPDVFTRAHHPSEFNKKVRQIDTEHHNPATSSFLIDSLSKDLEFTHPSTVSWPVKYDNKGIFIFELYNEDEKELVEDHLVDSLHLFGFCPVF